MLLVAIFTFGSSIPASQLLAFVILVISDAVKAAGPVVIDEKTPLGWQVY